MSDAVEWVPTNCGRCPLQNIKSQGRGGCQHPDTDERYASREDVLRSIQKSWGPGGIETFRPAGCGLNVRPVLVRGQTTEERFRHSEAADESAAKWRAQERAGLLAKLAEFDARGRR